MKVILYMAMTVNGLVAKENDDTSFTSEVEWGSFRDMINKVGNMIIGSRTYEVMKKSDEFKDLDKIKVVIVSRRSVETLNSNHFVVKSPKEALEFLKKKGFKEALVAGGGMLNGSFMEEKLVDEVFLDIEPKVLGKGIQLFGNKDFEVDLELVETKNLSKNEIQMHYKVKK